MAAGVPARWTPVEDLHITMRFLGSVADERIPIISDAVAAAVAEHVDITVRLAAAGAFPSAARARVLWVGIEDPAGGLSAIAGSLTERMADAGFGPEARAFRPHVTVARLKNPTRVEPSSIQVEPVRFTVDRLTLFESHLGGRPARYESISTYPFRRPLTAPRPDGNV